MALDPVVNFAKVTVVGGYGAGDTSIALVSGNGSKLSSAFPFNLVWWNWSNYPDPADDPNVEIVQVTSKSGDTLTVVRAQEGTTASAKNATGATYKMVQAPTAKTISDLASPAITFAAIVGMIAVTQMAGGVNASTNTFWRGDGTWATIPAGAQQTLLPSLGINVGATPPTGQIAIDTGATSNLLVGSLASGGKTYNAIALNNALTLSSITGLAGGASGDENLYLLGANAINLVAGGVQVASIGAAGLSTGNVTAAALQLSAFDLIDIAPTGNSYQTDACLLVQAAPTGNDANRRYMACFGLTAAGTAGSGANEGNVALYAGVVANYGAGYVWSINPLLTLASGYAGAGGYVAEFNGNNNTGTDFILGSGQFLNGISVISGGTNHPSVGLAVGATNDAANSWCTGVAVDNASQYAFYDSSNASVGLCFSGAHDWAIDAYSLTLTGGGFIRGPGGNFSISDVGSVTVAPVTGFGVLIETNVEGTPAIGQQFGLGILQTCSGNPSIENPTNYFYLNCIEVVGDNISIIGGGNPAVMAFAVIDNFGGANANGGRAALHGELTLTAATAPGNANRNYVGVLAYATAQANDNGTSGSPAGAVFAYGGVGKLATGATDYLNVTFMEANVSVESGASVYYKSGIQIADNADDAVQGSQYDCALAISNQTNLGWKNGILFGPMNGEQPFTSTSTIIATSGSCTVDNGIDLSSYTFAGYALHTPAFTVDGSGNVSAHQGNYSAYLWAYQTTADQAGGAASGGIGMGSSGIGLTWGTGPPTVAMAQGSLYLRRDGAPYFNINGGTGWSALAPTASPSLSGTVTLPDGSTITSGGHGSLVALGVGEATPGAGNINISGLYYVSGAQLGAANLANGTTGAAGSAIVLANGPTLIGIVTLSDGSTISSGGHANLRALGIGESLPSAGNCNISGVYQVAGVQIAASNLSNGTTGSGSIVLASSPTLGGTVTMPDSSTLTANGLANLKALGVGEAVPSAGNCNIGGQYQVGGTQISAANLANGTTGSGAVALATSPSFTTPALGAATATAPSAGTSGNSVITSAWFWQNLLAGLVNKFRNAAMDIWQRGTAALTVTTAGAYTADGWIVTPTGASVTVAQASGRLLTVWSLQITGATSVTDVTIKQRIESYVAAPLTSQTITVQARIYNGTGSAFAPTITVKTAGSQDSWTSPTTVVNAASLQSCTNGAWTLVAYSWTDTGGAVNGVEVTIDFGNNLSSAAKSVRITELDCRVTPGQANGTISAPPTPPDLRPLPLEQEICDHYYQAITFPQSQVIVCGQADAGGSAAFPMLPWRTVMRTSSPTITLPSTSSTNGICPMTASAGVPGTIGTITATANAYGFWLQCSGFTSAFTAGNACGLVSYGAAQTISASCEL